VQQELETFLASTAARERPVPRFVERELRAFLRCGIPAYGFVRAHCDGCGLDRVVAFSCKGRGFCPSRGGRRMADTAAHLVDRVLPEVPVRQWVLSLPFALRYRPAYDAPLVRDVLAIFVQSVFTSLRRRARKQWAIARGHGDAVTFVQRFGDALNLNVHFHSLVLDGVYARSENGALRFHPLPPPDDVEVERVARQVARRLARLLERRGLGDDAAAGDDILATEEPLLASLYAASITSRVATGSRAGQRVLRMGDRIDAGDLPVLQGERCATVGGVSVHANVAVPARDRRRLERLCRYGARPPVATERLSRLEDGRLLYRLKHRWRDGTTHVVFTPQELVEKLAALVPPPRFHLVRYHGVLGPCGSERDRIVPAGQGVRPIQSSSSPESASTPSRVDGDPAGAASATTPDSASIVRRGSMPECERLGSPSFPVASAGAPARPDAARARRLAWAELMKRVFAIDVLECPRCRGPRRILAAIHPPETTSAILACLGLPVRAPPLAPARRDDGFDDEAADQSPADFES